MSEVTPIRPDVSFSDAPKRKRRSPRTSGPKISVEAVDTALNDQCCDLYEAMGIVALATDAIRNEDGKSVTNAWAALDGAYKLLKNVVGRLQTSETLLAQEAVDNTAPAVRT
jgi:hypothetical protein